MTAWINTAAWAACIAAGALLFGDFLRTEMTARHGRTDASSPEREVGGHDAD